DVARFLRLFTLLPMDEIRELEKLEGADLREAKRVLAREATALTHGEEEARKAETAAKALFVGGASSDAVRTHEVPLTALEDGIAVPVLFTDCGLCESRSAARRLASQGGLYIEGETVREDRITTSKDLRDGALLLRAGKKKHCRVVARDGGTPR